MGDTTSRWRYILTRESVFDPAGKLNYKTHTDEIRKRFGNEYYYEDQIDKLNAHFNNNTWHNNVKWIS